MEKTHIHTARESNRTCPNVDPREFQTAIFNPVLVKTAYARRFSISRRRVSVFLGDNSVSAQRIEDFVNFFFFFQGLVNDDFLTLSITREHHRILDVFHSQRADIYLTMR